MYKRTYSLMEIKQSLEASERIPLNAFTRGHSLERHHTITDAQLRARAVNVGSSVSAFPKGAKHSDQYHSVAFLLNGQLGQQALEVLDMLKDNAVETKKGNPVTRVAVTGKVETGPFPVAGARFAHNVGPLGSQQGGLAEKMTVVLEVKPRGFPAPLYIVTAFPQPASAADKIEPTKAQVAQWINNTELQVGRSISNLFK